MPILGYIILLIIWSFILKFLLQKFWWNSKYIQVLINLFIALIVVEFLWYFISWMVNIYILLIIKIWILFGALLNLLKKDLDDDKKRKIVISIFCLIFFILLFLVSYLQTIFVRSMFWF